MDKELFINKYTVQKSTFGEMCAAGDEVCFQAPCIGYVIRGSFSIRYKGKVFEVKRGDLICLASSASRFSVLNGKPDAELYSVGFSFFPPAACMSGELQVIEGYARHIVDEMFATYDDDFLYSVSCLYRLLSDLHGRARPTEEGSGEQIVAPALEYIGRHCTERIRVSELAHLCNYSESGFYKIFKEQTGMTPIRYKHGVLIRRAVELLQTSEKSVDEISYELGFSSANYFRKVFYSVTGKTPRQIRGGRE